MYCYCCLWRPIADPRNIGSRENNAVIGGLFKKFLPAFTHGNQRLEENLGNFKWLVQLAWLCLNKYLPSTMVKNKTYRKNNSAIIHIKQVFIWKKNRNISCHSISLVLSQMKYFAYEKANYSIFSLLLEEINRCNFVYYVFYNDWE